MVKAPAFQAGYAGSIPAARSTPLHNGGDFSSQHKKNKMTTFTQPMLASPANLEKLQYPLMVSPKLDGIRATVVNGCLLSRKLKPIPNEATQKEFGGGLLEGLDGELIVGSETAHDVYRKTNSGVMTKAGDPQARFFIFDRWDMPERPFLTRNGSAYRAVVDASHALATVSVVHVRQQFAYNVDDMLEIETQYLEQGYEGVMLRDPNAPYKFGRSTTKEGILLKLKRFTDSEAVILDVVEEMANMNEATVDERGYTKRSSHQDNKVGKGRMGALLVRDLTTGVEFQIGTGFDAADRAEFWEQDMRGKIVKYKSFSIGVKDKPRFPSFLGLRSEIDL